MQRHAERETREMEPPLETVKTLHSTLRLESPDPDGSRNYGGRAGGTTVPGSRQEGGEPAKKER